MSTETTDLSRNVVCKRIKVALKKRSGKDWSVTGGKGTAWGWINIDAPPARRTWQHVQTSTPEPPSPSAQYRGVNCVTPNHYVCAGAEDPILSPVDDPWAREAIQNGRTPCYDWEVEDTSKEFGHMSPADRQELGKLLGMERAVHYQGQSIPSGGDYYREYLDRAEGRTPSVHGTQYWD
jgi:hypothetical protein